MNKILWLSVIVISVTFIFSFICMMEINKRYLSGMSVCSIDGDICSIDGDIDREDLVGMWIVEKDYSQHPSTPGALFYSGLDYLLFHEDGTLEDGKPFHEDATWNLRNNTIYIHTELKLISIPLWSDFNASGLL